MSRRAPDAAQRAALAAWCAADPGPILCATVLWVPICLAMFGSTVWYGKAKPLSMATCWAWLIRMNAAGLVVGLLMK